MNKNVSCQSLNHCIKYQKCYWNLIYHKPKKEKKTKKEKKNICWNWEKGLVNHVALIETVTFDASYVTFVVCVVASTPFVIVVVEFSFVYILHGPDAFVWNASILPMFP